MKSLDNVNAGWLANLEDGRGPALIAFADTGGVWTIGYGTTRWTPTRKVQQGDKLNSVAEAIELYRAQLKNYVAEVSGSLPDAIEDDLTDPQFSALVSRCYNQGLGNLRRSETWAGILAGKDVFQIWRQEGLHDAKGVTQVGLIRRRYCEAVAWRYGRFILQDQAKKEIQSSIPTVEPSIIPQTINR